MVLTYSKQTKLGNSPPPFALPCTDGTTYPSDSFKDAKVIIVVFTCNHCPYAILAKPKLEYLYEQYKDRGVQFVAINSNESENYPEDSFEKMKGGQYNFPFPYLRDESQIVAKRYGAVCTPDIFIYDQEQKLAYRGQLDDERPDDQPQLTQDDKNYVQDIKKAIDALLDNKKPSTEQKPSVGCSIKWK